MSRFIKRAAVGAAVGALAVTSLALTGAPPASGQDANAEAGPVPIEVLAAPPRSAAPATSQASPGSRGTLGAGIAESGMAPEATVAAPPEADYQTLGEPESVIGPDGRQQVTNTTVYPARAIGQITIFQNSGPRPGNFICTGWLIDRNTILTSGHCAFEGGFNDPIASAQFFPGRNGASNPFGGCNVVGIFAKAGWRNQAKAKDDWAVMQLDCNIGNTVGWLGYFSVPRPDQLDGKTGRVEGYPGDKPPGTHWKMSGTMHRNSNANMIRYRIDTAGGQSGSPIMVANRPSCGGPCGMGIHSYGAFGNPPTNSGPRITGANFNTITAQRQLNG